jgi:hypothetical protein
MGLLTALRRRAQSRIAQARLSAESAARAASRPADEVTAAGDKAARRKQRRIRSSG